MSQDMKIVIGLEVHVQLATKTKLFCACSTETFGKMANTSICPVCTGQPGVLPVLNETAVELGFVAASAVGCTIRDRSIFARKNYFYPDLPRGYQISQYDQPFSENGVLEIPGPPAKRIGITRIHMEDDAGKSLHAIGSEELSYSLVDFNRAGMPLIEIVSEPDMRTPDEAYQYLTTLKTIMQYCGVSRCDMEKGELRCDANISVRHKETDEFGTKVEIKNLNSFKAVREALVYEYSRQCAAVADGETIRQETRLWDAEAGRTESMRSKEEAQDYRYFPEPDLVPLVADDKWVEAVRKKLPELPAARNVRFIKDYKLSDYDAGVLTADRHIADYFEKTIAASNGAAPKSAANWVTSDLMGKLNGENKSVLDSNISSEALGSLILLIDKGTINIKIAKEVFVKMWETGKSASEIVKESGLEQVQDSGQIAGWVEEAINENPKAVEQFKGGKEKAIGAIVGAVMKKSKGKANPAMVNKLIKEKVS
jgi:aspartyl-tRNA(Asn)/glutamyl-tRNA(Gln) amidotransferase subunit B